MARKSSSDDFGAEHRRALSTGDPSAFRRQWRAASLARIAAVPSPRPRDPSVALNAWNDAVRSFSQPEKE